MNKSAARKILHSAFTLDRRGNEALAIPLYQKALKLGLNHADQRSALICLASSLRTTGKFPSALSTLRRAHRLFPGDPVVGLFMALVYHDMARPSTALRLLGAMCLNQARDRRIAPYRNVLLRKFRAL